MDSRQRSVPNKGTTVREIFSHDPTPRLQAETSGTSAKAPFSLPCACHMGRNTLDVRTSIMLVHHYIRIL
ncbi:hypothetical protein MM59RIKEN_34340 (plasmid) [Pusillibacter faecalis]|uniref:Uncharacterized protein n=1 Tax=Pusillibacter faecalis TaxID=2714358 RepID=A0A830U8T0_9FIRM|nr:hypothetical protein MM59RIKEN_34340 [Pusillibacter faecalis]